MLFWAVSLIIVWLVVSYALHQPIWTQHSSRAQLDFGVIKGEYFGYNEGWKLIASQWLHVKAPHMLFNALILAGVGAAAEKRWGRALPGVVALTGGTLSQALLVILQPQNFLSGASQAYMALCGFALAGGRISLLGLVLAWMGVVLCFGIDLFMSDHGQIKVGHIAPLLFGATVGLFARLKF